MRFCASIYKRVRVAVSSVSAACSTSRSNAASRQRCQFHPPTCADVNHCRLKAGSALPPNRCNDSSSARPASPLPADQNAPPSRMSRSSAMPASPSCACRHDAGVEIGGLVEQRQPQPRRRPASLAQQPLRRREVGATPRRLGPVADQPGRDRRKGARHSAPPAALDDLIDIDRRPDRLAHPRVFERLARDVHAKPDHVDGIPPDRLVCGAALTVATFWASISANCSSSARSASSAVRRSRTGRSVSARSPASGRASRDRHAAPPAGWAPIRRRHRGRRRPRSPAGGRCCRRPAPAPGAK